MHLWPSITIRESFKISYLKKLEWNLQRMNSEKKRQSQSQSSDQEQTLLLHTQRNEPAEVSTSKNSPSAFLSFGKEMLLILSCCYCCFCCGACNDKEDS